jgi:hypothetical protein
MDDDDLIILAAASRRRRRAPYRDPIPFAQTRRPIEEWLDSPILLFNTTGLRAETIARLCVWLRQNTQLDNGKNRISLEEKLLMFLHICRKGAGYRETQIVFNHSTDIISYAFRGILRALVQLYYEVVSQCQPEQVNVSLVWLVINTKQQALVRLR